MKNFIQFSCLSMALLSGELQAQTISNDKSSSLIFISGEKGEGDKSDRENFDLGTATFSTEDKRIALNYFGYFAPKSSAFPHFFIGLTGGGAAKNSTASILSNNQVVAEGDAGFRTGIRLWNNHPDYTVVEGLVMNGGSPEEIQLEIDKIRRSDLWIVGNVGLTGSSFKLYYPTNSFNEQVIKQTYTSREANVGVNYWTSRLLGGTVLAGGTIGVRYSDNFDNLVESTKEDTRLLVDSLSGVSRRVTSRETVYQGTYKNEIVTFPLNLDIFYAPDRLKNLALLATSNTIFTENGTSETKVGFGFFILKHNNPTAPIGGIVLSYSDVFNEDKTDDVNGAKSKFSIALTTRVNLLRRQR